MSNWNSIITDEFFRLRYKIKGTEKIDPSIAHIVLDDNTIKTLNLSFWDRSIYLNIFKLLKRTDIKAIAFDILFQHKMNDEIDYKLVLAAKSLNKMFLPIVFNPIKESAISSIPFLLKSNKDSHVKRNLIYPKIINKGNPFYSDSMILSFNDLTENVSGIGHINCNPDIDGINRKFPLIYKFKDGYLPSLTFQMLLKTLNIDTSKIQISFGEYLLLKDVQIYPGVKKDIRIPIDRRGQIIINYAGPWKNSFEAYPVQKLLKAENDEVLFSGLYDLLNSMYVILSDISVQNKDYGTGILDNLYPLSGIHINILNMILTDNFISHPPIIFTLIICFILSSCLFIASNKLKPKWFFIISILIYFIFICFSFIQFILLKQLPVIVIPTIGFILSFLVLNIYRYISEEKEKMIIHSKFIAEEKLNQLRDRFIQNVTHEFRNPLALILGPTELLMKKINSINPDYLKKQLDIVKGNSEKLLNLIDELLEFSKIKDGKMDMLIEQVNLIDFINKIIMFFEPVSKQRKIKICFEYVEKIILINLDVQKFEKVISNLLSNALKFSSEGKKIIVQLKKSESGAEISIKDEGSGINDDEIAHIFDRFYRAKSKPRIKGSGIGLSLVKEYVELHKSKIDVKSKVGIGTEFIIYLSNKLECNTTRRPQLHNSSDFEDNEIIINPQKRNTSIAVSTSDSRQIKDVYQDPLFKEPVLIVDDEAVALETYKEALQSEGVNSITLCDKSENVMSLLSKNAFSAVILDLQMPGKSGKDLLSEIKLKYPQTPVIVVTGMEEVETAVECMKIGAYDYFVKPAALKRLVMTLRHSVQTHNLFKDVKELTDKMQSNSLVQPEIFKEIITNHPSMLVVFKLVEAFAKSSEPVLITGESGVGKELIAGIIHKLSNLKGSFIPVNIAGLEDTLFSDTLFGHKKGAFTGATETRSGLLEKAKGGTIFLDEIGDLEYTSQVKLLRLLQEKKYYQLGTDVEKTTDARFIFATNKNLKKMQQNGTFRNDLFFRLIHNISIPPLRERIEDIPLLMDHFLDEISKKTGKQKPKVPKQLINILKTYSFPGNIRELESMVKNAITMTYAEKLPLEYFINYLETNKNGNSIEIHSSENPNKEITYSGEFPKLKEVEEYFIKEALKKAYGRQSIAAKLLGISTYALYRKLKK